MNEDEAKKKSIDSMLQDAAIEKFGLKPVMDKIEKIMPLLEQVAAGAEVLKGQDGKTPQLGVDYLTEEQQQSALEMVRPKKGVDYNDGERGADGYTPVRGIDYMSDEEVADIVSRVTPKKGKDYFTQDEIAQIKVAVTPKKGTDYNDGANPTPEQFLEVIKNLKGKDAAAFSETVGAKIDISHVRNAGSFIFNGKKYDTSELMHGGGGASGGGTVSEVDTGVGLTGGPITTTGTIELAADIAPIATLGSAGQLIRVNAGATALEYFTAAAGGVDTVVGTSNRITVDSTDPANPIVDIAATYVGQSSITTLGTIGTGTWNATVISLSKGGTGADLSGVAKGGLIAGTGAGAVAITTVGSDGKVLTADSGAAGGVSWQTPTTGTVTSVSGTSNRITSTGGATPVIDISASYVGQSSITTLGTIATGVWSATTIAVAKGGTGATTIAAKSIWLANALDTITSITPGAGQSIRINAGDTAWEAYTPAAGTVTSVSGTSNRITSTGGATPVIDISSSYVGQSSITTVGIITSGTWTGTTIAIANGGTGATSLAGASIPTYTSTNTFTNKRNTRRLVSVNAPGATPTTNSDNNDIAEFTGLNTAITSMSSSLTGTPVNGDLLEFRFLDDGTARGITWGASFAASTVALPTTTVISTMLRVGFEYQTTASLNKWVCIATA